MFKLLFFFVFLFETLDAVNVQTHEKNVSFSVEKVWQSYRKKDKCGRDASEDEKDGQKWIKGVQQLYDGCRTASWKFHGRSYELADTVMNSFQDHLVKWIYFSNSNSTVLTSSSSSVLVSLSKLNKLRKNGLIIIREYSKALPEVVREFNEVVRKLENTIGQLATAFNDVLDDLGYILTNFMEEFVKSYTSGTKCENKVDYLPVLKQYQKLMNIVALIAETLLNECELVTREVDEAIVVFSLFYQHFTIGVQGVNSCVQDIMFEQECPVSENTNSYSTSLGFVLVEVTQAVSSIMFPLHGSIEELLATIVNITMAFNTAVKDILGIFEGVSITVDEIQQNLSNCVKKTDVDCGGGAKKTNNFLKGISSK